MKKKLLALVLGAAMTLSLPPAAAQDGDTSTGS